MCPDGSTYGYGYGSLSPLGLEHTGDRIEKQIHALKSKVHALPALNPIFF